MKRSLIGLGFIVLLCLIQAQTPVPPPPPQVVIYGRVEQNRRNLRPTVQITGVPSPNFIVTGTNAWVGVSVGAMNFAFIDASYSAMKGQWYNDYPNRRVEESHAYSLACLYPISGYVGIDRCELGWKVDSLDVWRKPFHTAFWAAILDGQTVSLARNAGMNAVKALMLHPDTSELFTLNGEFDPNLPPTDYVAVYGDYYKRLKNVYTGDDTSSATGWYWSIP